MKPVSKVVNHLDDALDYLADAAYYINQDDELNKFKKDLNSIQKAVEKLVKNLKNNSFLKKYGKQNN